MRAPTFDAVLRSRVLNAWWRATAKAAPRRSALGVDEVGGGGTYGLDPDRLDGPGAEGLSRADRDALPGPRPDALGGVRALAARYFFTAGAVMALCAALLSFVLPVSLPVGARQTLVALLLGYAGLALLATRLPTHRAEPTVALMALLTVGVVAAQAAVRGAGVDASLGYLVVTLALAASVLRPALIALIAALATLATLTLAWAQWRGFLPGAASVAFDQVALSTAHIVLMMGLGVVGGRALAKVVARSVLQADARERHLQGLMAVTADAYWELDDEYRLVALNHPPGADGAARVVDAEALGHLPWALPQLLLDPETQDLLQANLDARALFRDLALQWVTHSGEVIHVRVSGEPRFDARGVFRGFWGVARNVTEDVNAREALAATEGRFQDLFEHIPTPLLLHRNARIVDANPAAHALLADDGQDLTGTELLALWEDGDSRERARRRMEELESQPLGRALPVTDYRLRGRGGRRIAVRGTGVRVDAPDEAAVLTILVDDTERRVAEDAVRRSETMLSHLVATSPDMITLSELATGRYAMVNQAFEHMTGYTAEAVVGKSSTELGLWDAQDRAQFVARIKREGAVQDVPVRIKALSGEELSLQVSGARFIMDRREYLVINGRDISVTERERQVRATILHAASIGIALTREDCFVLANPCLERMCGWPEGGLAGQSAKTLWGGDADYAHLLRSLGPAMAHGTVGEIETRVQRRDGSSFLGRITANPIDPTHPQDGGTVWIIEDVTGQRQAESALARARDEAEAANRAKSAFLANTSHELRTPLNGMIGMARLAREPGLDESRRRQYLEQIGESAQSLSVIITDILDLSKIEAGKLELESVPFQLGDLLRNVHQGYVQLADTRDLAVSLELGLGVDGTVRGDALRVRQILGNYLTNAVKFTERGSVRLLARRLDARQVRFEVHDTGPGIEGQVQERLFQPFTQVDESTTRRFGGTGLGLSICRELAVLMGGRVGVDSQPGHGSCFWAVLPLPGTDPLQPTAQQDAPQVRGARVLMVEDNPVNMLIVAAMLEQWGVTVEQATDGAQAVAAVAQAAAQGKPFDAVLMDVQMPIMSGYEATRVLRLEHGADSLPIVALTAAALVSERDEALSVGMNDFLTKPIDPDRLRATLARWVGWRSALRA